MYIRKKYRRLLDLADKQFTIPTSFQRFIDEKTKLHNLVIKGKGGQCWCTCCGHNFVSQTKVNCMIKCPNCKQYLLIKTDRLKYHVFKDCLQLLDKIEGTFVYVLRSFELYTSYNNGKVRHKITEFMRTIIEGNEVIDFVTNQTHNHFGCIYVSHYGEKVQWKGRNRRWAYRDVIGMVCPYNLKSLLNNTDLKYSQLDKFVARKNDYIDFIEYFTKKAHYPSFEYLVKMKLYHLARDADSFNRGNNFQEVFGISKSFYPFMKKHDITYNQLKVLRLLQKEDIKLINKLLHIGNLEELSRYVDLEKAYYQVLRVKGNNEYDYLDYLEACMILQYPMKSSKVLYPNNLREEHDKVTKLVKIVENEANDRLIKQRLKELNKYIYKDEQYVVFPAPSVESLLDESEQLGHCVKTYAERYALAKTDIYFLREIEHQNQSLVTIEVRDHDILQARTKYNGTPTKEQLDFLELWKNKILNNASI